MNIPTNLSVTSNDGLGLLELNDNRLESTIISHPKRKKSQKPNQTQSNIINNSNSFEATKEIKENNVNNSSIENYFKKLSFDNVQSLPTETVETNHELPRKRARKSQNQLLIESMKDHFANGLSAHNASNRIMEHTTRLKETPNIKVKTENCIKTVEKLQPFVNNTAKPILANQERNQIHNGNPVPLISSLTKGNLFFSPYSNFDHSYAKVIPEENENSREEYTGSNLSKFKFLVETQSNSSSLTKNHSIPNIKIEPTKDCSRKSLTNAQSTPPIQSVVPSSPSLHLPSTSRAWRPPSQTSVHNSFSIPKPIGGCSFYYQGIRVQKQSDFVIITFRESNRSHNFLHVEALKELQTTLNEATEDQQCKLVIIGGSTNSFCSGLDLRLLLLENRKQTAHDYAENIEKLAKTLHEFSKPIIACVTGPAINFGVTLLCYCDQVICSNLATFQMLNTSLGYLAEGGATLMLPSIVGTLVASNMLLQGRKITALQGLSHKIVSTVVPYSDVYSQTLAHATKMLEYCTQTQRLTKMMLRNSQTAALRECLNYEKTMLPQHWLSDITQREIQITYENGALSENSP